MISLLLSVCIPFPADYFASLRETAWHEDLNRISSEGSVMYTAWQAFVVNTFCTEEMSFIINPHTALTAFFIMHFSCNPVLLLFPNCSLIKLYFCHRESHRNVGLVCLHLLGELCSVCSQRFTPWTSPHHLHLSLFVCLYSLFLIPSRCYSVCPHLVLALA